MMRTALPVATMQTPISNAVRQIDASLPIIRLRNMEEVFRDSVRRPRMVMQLLGAFAALGLLLAVIGTYGLLSYIVTQRKREIGIRMALGAARAVVLRAMIGHGLKLTCAGLALGLGVTLLLTRFLQALLFEVGPSDPATLAGGVALIIVVSIIASLVPALRAAHVDPAAVLKDD
jgi:putative ABC transport system permease protein